MQEMRNSYKILDAKPEERRPLGRQTAGWVDNIKLDLTAMVCGKVNRIRVTWY
jgi:hypothetical protein